jgi:hypothetical protein
MLRGIWASSPRGRGPLAGRKSARAALLAATAVFRRRFAASGAAVSQRAGPPFRSERGCRLATRERGRARAAQTENATRQMGEQPARARPARRETAGAALLAPATAVFRRGFVIFEAAGTQEVAAGPPVGPAVARTERSLRVRRSRREGGGGAQEKKRAVRSAGGAPSAGRAAFARRRPAAARRRRGGGGSCSTMRFTSRISRLNLIVTPL